MNNLIIRLTIPLKICIILQALATITLLLYVVGVFDLFNRLHLYVILYVMITSAFVLIYYGKNRVDLFSPILGLLGLLFLYSVSSGLYAEQYQATYQGDIISGDTLSLYYVSCLIGLVSLAGGTLFSKYSRYGTMSARDFSSSILDNELFRRKIAFYATLFGIIMFPFVWSYFDMASIPSYAERSLALRVERQGDVASGIKEVFTTYLPVTLILSTAILCILYSHRRIVKVLASLVFLVYIFRNTMAGWRGLVVSPIALFAIFYHYRVKRISVLTFIAVAMALYVFMSAVSFTRSTSDPSEMFELVRNEIAENGLERLSLRYAGELQVASNLMRLIEGIKEHETTYTWGLSVFTEFLAFIPKQIFPNRPLPISEKYVDVFYPGDLEAGAGYGFFIIQEGYWALGLFGVFLFMFTYGWVVERIYHFFMKNIKYDVAALSYGMVYVSLVLYGVRSGVIANFKIALIYCLPFILILILPKLGLIDKRQKGK